MLKIKQVLCVFSFSALLVACTEEIDYRQAKDVNGLFYKQNGNEPFSGKILNYPLNLIGIPGTLDCAVDVENGMPDGVMECTKGNSVVYTGEYTRGKRNGSEHVFSDTGTQISSSHWRNGVKNGLERKYNKDNGRLISETSYLNGAKEGPEKVWAEDGTTELVNLIWKDGKQSGFRVEGYGDHINYLDGQYHGLIKKVGIFDGNQLFLGAEINYQHGKKEGSETLYIAADKIEKSNTYKNGQLISGTTYLYESDGLGEVIGHYHVVRIDASKVTTDNTSLVVYDGQQKGTHESKSLFYEVDWDKGALVRAEAFKVVNGDNALVYKGVNLTSDIAVYNPHFPIKLFKDGIEDVFHGDEFVGQVVWDNGEPVSYAVKYNRLYSDQKESNDFAVLRPTRKYIKYGSQEFTNPTRFEIIDEGHVYLNNYDVLGVEKIEPFQNGILETASFKKATRSTY